MAARNLPGSLACGAGALGAMGGVSGEGGVGSPTYRRCAMPISQSASLLQVKRKYSAWRLISRERPGSDQQGNSPDNDRLLPAPRQETMEDHAAADARPGVEEAEAFKVAMGTVQAPPRLLILFGSETGNAQDVAERIAREALRRHFRPRVLPADSYEPPETLQEEQLLVLVAATAGQGEVPANLKRFWRFLLRKKHPSSFLGGVSYAVFGLGDSSYQHYNVAAKKLDRRLLDLGASPLLPRGLGDDQHPSGYEAALDPWLASLWAALRLKCPLHPPLQDPAPSDPAPPLGSCKLRVTLFPPPSAARQGPGAHAPGVPQATEDGGLGEGAWVQWTPGMSRAVAMMDRALGGGGGAMLSGVAAAALAPAAPKERRADCDGQTAAPAEAWGRSRPFLARLVENRRLTAEEHSQDVRHLGIDIAGSGMTYSPGDVAHVWPCQSSEAVRAFIERCRLDPDAHVLAESCEEEGSYPGCETRDCSGAILDSSGRAQNLAMDGNGHVPVSNGGAHPYSVATGDGANGTPELLVANGAGGTPEGGPGVTVFDLVAATLDVASASPRRFLFEVLSQFASDEVERERLCFFASTEGRDELYEYNQRERRTVLEVLEEFPSVHVPLPWLLQACPRLRPRDFSIASSPLAHPGQCQLTVAVVRHQTPFKRTRWGLCSRWLSLHPASPQGSTHVPLWLSLGYLHLPPAPIPLILVGPGTGCAPFRSFIHHRAELAHRQAAGGVATSQADGVANPGLDAAGEEGVGPVLFFFGCRNEDKDFLYRKEWEDLGVGPGAPLAPARGGGFFAAFSRDQERKIYVQHRIREQAHKVWGLLRQGAAVFVAGSASKMPSDVMAALADVVAEEGLLGKEDAAQWVKGLQRVGRMYVECWS